MAARILDGKACAAGLRAALEPRAAVLAGRGLTARAAIVQVGEDEASASYVRSLLRAFESAGAAAELVTLPPTASQAEVAAHLDRLSADPAVHGLMLQLPLPAGLDSAALITHIDPAKDLDGVHPLNAGKLFLGQHDGFVPATALGGVWLLEREEVPIAGSHAVVVGRSAIVGRPLAMLLLHRQATVTICHSRTRNLADICRGADLLAVAVGRAGFITPDLVRPGASVIDFGTNYVEGKLRGDVDPAVAEVAGALSPTPGGTGAVTTAALLHNAFTAAERLAPRP